MSHPPDTPAHLPRILLVEDDAALLRALAFSLRIEGYEVTPMDCAEALLAQGFDEPVVIVTDQNLPRLTGMEAIALLRRRGVSAPVVLISADLPRGVDAQARSLGVTIVEKPILGDGLIVVLGGLSGTART